MPVYFVVDRLEGRFAIVEYDGAFYDVPKGSMRPGQVFRWTGKKWVRDRAEELMRMRASDPGGNIRL